jgi:hypothetical protein
MVSRLAYQKDKDIPNDLFIYETQAFAIILVGGNKIA